MVWKNLFKYWKDNKFQDHFTHIKLSMIHKPDDPHDSMPRMKGKAIECRNLMPALIPVWESVMDAGCVGHQAVLVGLQASVEMDAVLDANRDVDVLPAPDAHKFVEASWLYVNCQNAAAQFFNTQTLMIFDITIKTHYTCHCALVAPFLNPRLCWNFAGEDFMQKCKILHQSCVRGNSVHQSVCKFAEKYCIALHLQLVDFEKGIRS